jgi:hypothetical protein
MDKARQLQTVSSPTRFELLTAEFLKSQFFWNVVPCCSLSRSQHFVGTLCLQLQGLVVQEQSLKTEINKQLKTK